MTAVAWVGLTPAGPVQATDAGLQRLQVPHHDTQIEVALFYPTTTPARSIDAGPWKPRVSVQAPIESTRHPLILISHGTGGTNLNYYPLAQALAGAGFLVASLTHPGDNAFDRSLIADARYFQERPRQVSRVIDALLADPVWRDRIDATRIGAVGHSAGGYTVAALVGAVPEIERLQRHCRDSSDDPSCALRDPTIGVAQTPARPFVLPASTGPEGAVADRRIRAVVMLAPFAAVFVPGSLKAALAAALPDRTIRVRLIGAEHDEVLARAYHYDALRAELPAEASSLAAGAGHFSFIAPVEPSWTDRLGQVAKDPAGFDRAGYLERLGPDLVDWFRRALPPR